MSKFKVGFSRVNITPPLGVEIRGYYKERICDGVLDEIEANTIAFEMGKTKVIMMSVDTISLYKQPVAEMIEKIMKATGLKEENIFLHATHIHSGPKIFAKDDEASEVEKIYSANAIEKIVEGAVLALEDLKPAKMGYAVSKAEKVAFNRRYLMKDGSYKTNPGVNNPDIEKSAGIVDERVNVIRFDREGAETVILANFGNHPDVVGGNKITADWPGFTRRITEKVLDNVKCVFFNGCQGDINHVNVHPVGGDFNGMFNDFDDVSRGYAHARHMGNVMTGAILNVFEKVKYVDVDSLKCLKKTVQLPSNMPKPEELKEAYYIKKMHEEGKDSELPYKGMWLTTMVAGACRRVELEHGPETFPLEISTFSIGNVAFIGIPGEPFAGVGLGLKEAKGWDLVCPCCLTNGSRGYFPMQDSYDEGGYEAQTSRFKAGVAELIIKDGKKVLDELKKK